MKPSGWRQKLYNGTTVSVFLAMLGSNFKGEHKKSLNFFISCSLKQNKHHPTPPPPKMIFFPNLLLFKVESFEVYTHLPPPRLKIFPPPPPKFVGSNGLEGGGIDFNGGLSFAIFSSDWSFMHYGCNLRLPTGTFQLFSSNTK